MPSPSSSIRSAPGVGGQGRLTGRERSSEGETRDQRKGRAQALRMFTERVP